MSKYCSIAQTSTNIAKKTSVSTKDKSFDNIDMLDKALRVSNLLLIVDGSRKQPDVTSLINSGYSAGSIITTIDAEGSKVYTVIAEDDYYKFHADSIVAFTFMLSMINKDMHHMLSEAITKEDPIKLYRMVQEHFKGGKNHHVEVARRKLSAHRCGPDIVRDMSRLLELISDLEIAQKMEMPESQKFGILRTIMRHEERAHVKSVYGLASYHKESFNSTVTKKLKKSGMPYRQTRSKLLWRQAWHHYRPIESATNLRQTHAAGQNVLSYIRLCLNKNVRTRITMQSCQVKRILRASLQKALAMSRILRVNRT